MGKRIIRWDKRALHSFLDILNYIRKDSPTNSLRVKTRIVNIIASIPDNPEMFREDELKADNDGTFRVFSHDNLRVSYKIERDAVFILKVKHSMRKPKVY
jgi:plasmid stabilization system protein ParE